MTYYDTVDLLGHLSTKISKHYLIEKLCVFKSENGIV